MNELSKEKLKHYATHMEGPVKAMARELLALRERAEPACVTAEHKRVIQLLLNVCGAAFELADDSCQQIVDGENCHVVPDDSFQKLSAVLDEIENTLPDEYEDTLLQWGAIPRHALRGLLVEQPAPVVPAETFDEWSRRCEIQLTLCRPEFREVAEITWKACCAAMLAAPGKQPLSVDVLAGALRNAPLAPADNQGRQRDLVAAGWIACSERMPEKDGNYWAWWSESKRQGPAWFIKSKIQAQFQSSEITHWMPLPAAPGKER